MKVRPLETLPSFVTNIDLIPGVALLSTAIVTCSVVSVKAPRVVVIPVPLNKKNGPYGLPLASNKFVPVIVAVTWLPCMAVAGETLVIVAAS